MEVAKIQSTEASNELEGIRTTKLLLYRSGYLVGRYISLEQKIAQNKTIYYDVLEQCQAGWHEGSDDPTPFIKLPAGNDPGGIQGL